MAQKQGGTIEPGALNAPVHERIADDLRRKVRSGHWRAGALLPGRRELARDYGVAVKTLERAVSGLLADGTLRSETSRGTFVAESKEAQPYDEVTVLPSVPSVLSPLPTSSRTLTLGVIASVTSDGDDFVSQRHNLWQHIVIHAMEQSFSAEGGEGASIQFHNIGEEKNPAVVGEAAARLCRADSGIDALAIVLMDDPLLVNAIAAVGEAASRLMVFVPARELTLTVPQVSYDSKFAGHQAATHLLRQGHRELLFLAPVAAEWVDDRLQGVREAAAQFGLPPDAVSVSPGPSQLRPEARNGVNYVEVGLIAGRAALEDGIPFTGVIAANDHIAEGFLKAAGETGKTLGVDYALIGFDDYAKSREIGLTSLHPPLEAMGREAVRLLLRSLLYGENAAAQIRLRSLLIPRASTRPLPGLTPLAVK